MIRYGYNRCDPMKQVWHPAINNVLKGTEMTILEAACFGPVHIGVAFHQQIG